MKTTHQPIISDARRMNELDDRSIDLVVTSPPYPMIEMWDDIFSSMSGPVARALKKGKGPGAFEAMHKELDQVWQEAYRVLKPGGFACINIGDATRTLDTEFALYPNHARILSCCQQLGFSVMPCIIWRKQTNAPNKYMGSGMLPAGAYVTLEHEYILILRKGGKRVFKAGDPQMHRRESALFWEERNAWFSDVWMDLKGSRQALGKNAPRTRSGAFPFELAFRLINMYSVKGDVVLDPFMGTGTTLAAAMVSARNSIGIEIEPELCTALEERFQQAVAAGSSLVQQRLISHIAFVIDRMAAKGPLKHTNEVYGFPVMTAQEKTLFLHPPERIQSSRQAPFTVSYGEHPQKVFCRDWDQFLARADARLLLDEILHGPSLFN